jgi:hypothetical protein
MPPLARSTWPLIQAPSGPARKATARRCPRACRAFQRVHLGHAGDQLVDFAVEEEVGGGRAGRDGVDGDVAAAQFLRQDGGQRFDGGLGGGIDAVGFKLERRRRWSRS